MKRAAILAVVLFAAFPCLSQQSAEKLAARPCFVIAPFATDVKQVVFNGQDQLTYRSQESYPASDVLTFVSDKLKKMGWKPLKDDLWNPEMRSSHVRGWTSFEDATSNPAQRVYQWIAQWQDDKGNVVSYTLQYRLPESPALLVVAIYIPAERVARIKAEQKAWSVK